ncbi:MAG: transposase [Candidatus Gracilibacteria bacterium]|nr:transposase [Candidatus Gracilibacteria bacterium]
MCNILNRLGYNRKKIQKNKPLKKIPEVDEIFKNVHKINEISDNNSKSVRISIDAKAKKHIGNLSAKGKSRNKNILISDDHDTEIIDKLVPYGIKNMTNGENTFYFGNSKETADFIVDCIEKWLQENKSKIKNMEELVINLDNGPEQRNNRTQFLNRLVDLAKREKIKIHLAYYPPYHSKYNPIEHVFGTLEQYWNGIILDSVEKTLKVVKNMICGGKKPVSVKLIDKIYEKGVTIKKELREDYEKYLVKSEKLPKWDVLINPNL